MGSTVDLLSLIGRAIDQLRHSIDSFEAAEPERGLERLSTVIGEIDAYLERLDEDPLLRLASIDASGLQESLHQVQNDLQSVIDRVARREE